MAGFPESVHHNAVINRMLQEEAQKAFMEHFPALDFRKIFGKNFIENPEKPENTPCDEDFTNGFIPIKGLNEEMPF
jgi:hypothetical protein